MRVVRFGEFLRPNKRPYTLGPVEDANLVGMRLYGLGPFHRELKPAIQIRKKSHFVIRSGDIIYNKLFAWKGTFGIVPPELDGMFVSDKFPTYELNTDEADPNYLKWYFRTPCVWRQAQDLSTGSAAISKLTLNPPRFLDLTAPLPPLPEQRRIVAKIEELAAKIEEARGLRGQSALELSCLLGNAIDHIFTSLPNALWISGLLGDFVIDDCYGTSEKTNEERIGVPILRMGNIQDGKLDTSDLRYLDILDRHRDKWILRPLDVLVNRTNSAELVGKCAVFDLVGEWGFASYLIRLRMDLSRVNPWLVSRYINSPLGREYMFRERKQMTGQANVNSKKLKALPIRLPPLDEQNRLNDYLDKLQSQIEEAKRLQARTTTELDALLPSILDKAFKGEL